ncbi:hypothetical protein [Stackebrandtia soli]|uniref:hypothetical protein n=1 Tax=Stackebrandtia soli TaxID=1892856 RepID=UPI0039ED74B8
MTGFYVFEGSFFQGGGGWEHIELRNNLTDVRRAAENYVREGNWALGIRGETFQIRAYDGTDVVEYDLYPHTRVTVPGLTEVSFNAHGDRIGGSGVPGGPYDGLDEVTLWTRTHIAADISELAVHTPELIDVAIDWDAVGPRPLTGASIAESSRVALHGGTDEHLVIDDFATLSPQDRVGLVFGLIALADTDTDPETEELAEFVGRLLDADEDGNELGDEWEDLLGELNCGELRILAYGYNSLSF